MKKYILAISLFTIIFCSCDDFLDVKPKGLDLESEYYSNPQEAYAALVSIYQPLRDIWSLHVMGATSASDECYLGGGGAADWNHFQVWGNYTLDESVGPQSSFWEKAYQGIYRANVLLSKIDNIPGMTDKARKEHIAEAKFLRAYFNFWLVRNFKNVPLVTTVLNAMEVYDIEQAKPEDVYAQIEKDLNEAIPDLPETRPDAEKGRITKGAGYAMLGKTILYQNNTSRMLEAAEAFEKVNSSSHYALLEDLGEMFSPYNKFHSESIFEATHKGEATGFGNRLGDYLGIRDYIGPHFHNGYGFNPVIPEFAESMKDDPRYPYTIIDMKDLEAEGATYSKGYMHTGYFTNKYSPKKEYINPSYPAATNWEMNVIEIRLADTYLMQAEAIVRGGGDVSKAQYYLDKVRARVGLDPVPATLENIYEERRLELATEGHRWFDLVRTGKAAEVLAFRGFKEGVHEILPIPISDMNSTKLVQNPGYK
ncbi:RagB/SusD family nutrient uptake outer membrane protein [Bacteroides sp. 519]|uniref:RagB/SusD family nutrient uptake outer membrane protein n=1 Tax=Bacteroides sp. 519 TaxID=2302937 RepID=UPI0013D24F4A|nr:RagB/SusD family nutrient uptake outer membrane protein [Bacteroides sp. 519]NDV59484.1 RagB/SusD family nutrient uptake outer membrane protein [Bacteroides sp. 519]